MLDRPLILLAIIGLVIVGITSLVVGSVFAIKQSLGGASEFSSGVDALREGIIGGKDILTKDNGAAELSTGDDFAEQKEVLTAEGASEFSAGKEALTGQVIGPDVLR